MFHDKHTSKIDKEQLKNHVLVIKHVLYVHNDNNDQQHNENKNNANGKNYHNNIRKRSNEQYEVLIYNWFGKRKGKNMNIQKTMIMNKK